MNSAACRADPLLSLDDERQECSPLFPKPVFVLLPSDSPSRLKIGRWRTRSVFERYAIVSRSDMNDAILKLQESEKRAEQERMQEEERQAQIRTRIGHNDDVAPLATASPAVN